MAWAGVVFGQTVEPEREPPTTDADAAIQSTTLEEIVVTAQRREENLQKTALAIDVVSGSALANSAITSPTGLGQLVPSLSAQAAAGPQTTYFLRGVGNFGINALTDPAIAFNYDGVYIGRASGTGGTLYDLERVEVLKGPQGTLYGRNATGGAINVIPTRPQAGEFSGFVTGSYGDYDAVTLQGAVNVPLGSDAALRVSGNLADHDGYLSDGTSDQKDRAARVQLLAHLTPDLTLRVAGDYAHGGGKGVGSTYPSASSFNPVAGQFVTTPSGLSPSIGLFDPEAQAFRTTRFAGQAGRNLGPIDTNNFQDNDYYGANAQIDYTSSVGTLTIIPAFREVSLDYQFGVPGFTRTDQEDHSQYSLETRFAGERIGIFDYILGGYYFDETVKGDYSVNQDVVIIFQDFRAETESYAAFGQVTANLGERFRLVGGARYTRDEKSTDASSRAIAVVCTVRVAGVPSCPNAPVIPVSITPADLPFATVLNGAVPISAGGLPTGAVAASTNTVIQESLEKGRVTYRAAGEFDVGPRSLLYASFETGYRSGGFSIAVGHEIYQPEYLDAYTIGMKNRLFDNRLQLNAEAFLWDYRDQQVNHPGLDSNGNRANFIENIGRSTNKGIEIQSGFLLTPATLLNVSVLHLKTRYKDFTYVVPATPQAPPLVDCPVMLSGASAAIDCSGKPGFHSPEWTINFGGQQTIAFGEHKLIVEADTQYKSRRFIGFDYLPFQTVDPTWQTNAQITFSPEDERWAIGGFVRNIENERIPVTVGALPSGGLGTLVVGAPRTYGVRASMKF